MWVSSRERSSVAKLSVWFLATRYDKVLSFFPYLVANLFYYLLLENILVKYAYDFWAHDIPFTVTLNFLHIEASELVFEILSLVFVYLDLDFDKTSLLALLDIKK